MNPTFQGEVMLLGWSESHNGGAKVTFQLADPSDLEPFKAMTVAKGKTAGQRLACVLVEIGEDEQPVAREVSPMSSGQVSPNLGDTPKGGPLAKLAGMWCNDPKFWKWAADEFGEQITNAEEAAEMVRYLCQVASRAELDATVASQVRFHALIRMPYSEYLRSEQAREAA